MKNRPLQIAVAICAALALLGGGYAIGFVNGREVPKNVIVSGVANTVSEKAGADFGVFWEAWDTISRNYLRRDSLSSQDEIYGAIRGLVNSLGDPYSEYFTPSDTAKFKDDIKGNFGGIGAEIGMRKDQLTIIAPLKDTPASMAGLRAGDMILAINGTSTTDMSVDEAVNLIRGPSGSKVILSIYRETWDKPKDFTIIRAIINTPTLDYEIKDGNIAYLALHSFNANAPLLFEQDAAKLKAAGAKGIILDLRDDPGGYLEVAVNIAGWFLPKGTRVVSERGLPSSDQNSDFNADGSDAFRGIPAVVLINKGSASASEILAGALRDHGRATLVGEESFGKGTVQELQQLYDGSSIKLTVAHWILPKGQVLEGKGIMPDVEVKNSEEDVKNDLQLKKAVEILKSKMK